jgi:hypothetical protein
MALVKQLCCQGFGIIGLTCLLWSSPLHGAIHVSGGLFQESTLAVGATTQNVLLIQNLGNQAQNVILYQKDETFEQGVSSFLPVGSNERSNAPWIELETERLLVPAQTTLHIPYQMKVPDDSSLIGSYWSVVMVQAEAADVLAREQPEKRGVTVQQTFRTAVRLVTHLDSEPRAKPVLRFDGSALQMSDEGPIQLRVNLANPGVMGLYLRVFAAVIDQHGQNLGQFSPRFDQVRLLPTSEAVRTINFPDLVEGQYEIILVAENRDGQLFGARYVLTMGEQ